MSAPTHNPRRKRLAQAVSTISQTQADARRQQKGRAAAASPSDTQAAYYAAMKLLEDFFKTPAPSAGRL